MRKDNALQPKIPFPQKLALIIFGACLFFVLLEIGLRLGGFVFTSLQEHRNRVSIRQKGTYRILCLGESTTVCCGDYAYPIQLENILNQRSTGLRFSVINKGITGTDTNTILKLLPDNLNQYKPDMVITMMGVNDDSPYVSSGAANDSPVILFLRSSRVYKLARLLQLHIVSKARELNLLKPNTDNEESSLKQAIKLNPRDDGAYFELGEFYRLRGQLAQAVNCFKRAIELNPANNLSYFKLGWCYINQNKLSQAEEVFKNAIAANPKDDEAYVKLGKLYEMEGKTKEVEVLFKKAIELKQSLPYYIELGNFYIGQGKASLAKKVLNKSLDVEPQNDKAWGALSLARQEMGEHKSAEEGFSQANNLRLKYFNSVTVRNYQKVKEIISGNKVQLVCVQYPMRSVGPLKKIFEGEEGVIFVDNEKVFKDAVKKGSYREYFQDMNGGDFGHCTQKGNELLAQNIADTILNDYFKVYAKR